MDRKLLTILLIIFTLTFPISLLSLNSYFFLGRFEHYDVYANFSEEKSQLNMTFKQTVRYLNGLDHRADQEFYSNEDLIHLSDVRNLIILNHSLVLISLIGTLLLTKIKRIEWRTSVQLAAKITGFALLSVGSVSLLLFDQSFILFHKALFRNEYWMLDPSSSKLINFFPQEIFFETLVFYLFLIICLTLLFYLSPNVIIYKKKALLHE